MNLKLINKNGSIYASKKTILKRSNYQPFEENVKKQKNGQKMAQKRTTWCEILILAIGPPARGETRGI